MAKRKPKKPQANKKNKKAKKQARQMPRPDKQKQENPSAKGEKLEKSYEKPKVKFVLKDSKKLLNLLIALVLCLALMLSGFALAKLGFFDMVQGVFTARGKVSTGSLPISEGYDDVKNVPKGEVRYRINKNIVFESRYGSGDIMLENPESCEFNLVFSFYTKSDSKQIYKSPMIKPGEYIYRDKLQKWLKQGEYECTYKVVAYTADKVRVGETGGFLHISVET
ncbi:MAG: hypothetical protein GX345_08860 [Clostridiales bacterium]|jgi:hypothetical protein|nr:hypothetical protein [Clostridiales bacterium]